MNKHYLLGKYHWPKLMWSFNSMHMYLIFIGLQTSLKKKQQYQLGITNCAITLNFCVILVHYVLFSSFNLGWKHGILYILVTLSRLDENKHKITVKPMEKLVYIYIVIHYCALIFNFQIVSINFLSTCLCK
jgi:hypothetical protein